MTIWIWVSMRKLFWITFLENFKVYLGPGPRKAFPGLGDLLPIISHYNKGSFICQTFSVT
jgi:hypothetical protein